MCRGVTGSATSWFRYKTTQIAGRSVSIRIKHVMSPIAAETPRCFATGSSAKPIRKKAPIVVIAPAMMAGPALATGFLTCRNKSMNADEDSEEEEVICGENMQLLGQIESSGTTAEESAGNVDNSELNAKAIQALDVSGVTHPLDLMNKVFLHSVMPKLDVADQKLKELSVNQNELVKEMQQQKEKLHRAPALHKTHDIMRQVPQYQAKIDTLRKDMKAMVGKIVPFFII